ncbi:MAG: hypothetical protein LIO94_02320 [Clostridiales bacterium]|nr:hypothetical protein [Clostridiales bacterium]
MSKQEALKNLRTWLKEYEDAQNAERSEVLQVIYERDIDTLKIAIESLEKEG